MGHRRALVILGLLSAVAVAALLVSAIHFVEPLVVGEAPGRAFADMARDGDGASVAAPRFITLLAVHLVGVMVLAPVAMLVLAHAGRRQWVRRLVGGLLLGAVAVGTLAPYLVLPPPAESAFAPLATLQVGAVLAGAAAGVVAAAVAPRGRSLGHTVSAPLARAAPVLALACVAIIASALWEWSLFLTLSAS